ncbi:hypothetical protein SK128_000797 [Halocaridina rubra]|uniref:Ig-like domain-containing protein n=1 Tax=Halocaridina rubra TaxID=373956 RepID=A0AAN8XJF0_HALRR
MQASIMSFFPRIYQNARYAIAQEGDSIILPCRYQGTSLSRVWYRRNERISDEDPNHQVV